MDLLSPERSFKNAIRRAVIKALDLEPPAIPLTYPPSAELGDLATPICFELAKIARKAPREIAQRIVDAFEPEGEIARVEIAGAGYINAFVDRQTLMRNWLIDQRREAALLDGRIVVEHTNINPNKAAHIGHLSNAVLGDTLVRYLRRLGHRVEVQNYIDDTGVQVADLVVGFLHLKGEDLTLVRDRYSEAKLQERGERFDFIAWDLYADVTRFYEEDETRRALRADVIKAMEEGDNPTAELAAHVAHRIVQHHITTMDRIDVRYDLLPHESDILRLHFWETAFELLKKSGAIALTGEGKNAGCWVMNLPHVGEGAGEDQKVIVRSNGTVTYVGKDIAYQLWKFGLLGRDFDYREFDWRPAEARYGLWSTCSSDGKTEHPDFGRADRVYNVIDTRQSYLQRVVTLGLRSLGHDTQAEQSIHYSYDMVALTPSALSELFPDYPLSEEDRKKAYLEMAGRRGLGVRADDLLDRLQMRAAEEVRKRNPAMDDDWCGKTARQIAVGALRYYMLRFSRNRVVAFDLSAALAFEGETGPYLQYSVVRARNILAKVAERFGGDEVERTGLANRIDLAALDPDTLADHWNLASMLLRIDAVIRLAVDSLELSTVAKHAYVLAQAFNSFYHKYPVAQEEQESVRADRAALVRLYHDEMVDLLKLMGMTVPDRM